MTNEKRTIEAQTAGHAAQPDLPGMPPQGWGVGSAPTPLPPVGGGYLSICMPVDFSIPAEKKFDDPRISQLEAMGMACVFIDVAEAIGFDAFITMWQIFSDDPSLRDQSPSAMRITMRPIDSFVRYQRNRYIEHLFSTGMTNAEVRARLEEQLRLDRAPRESVRRIGEKARKKNVANRGLQR